MCNDVLQENTWSSNSKREALSLVIIIYIVNEKVGSLRVVAEVYWIVMESLEKFDPVVNEV